jgi:hypothetical protein
MVREGENPWMIAVRYDVDLNTIFYLNGYDENVLLHPAKKSGSPRARRRPAANCRRRACTTSCVRGDAVDGCRPQ